MPAALFRCVAGICQALEINQTRGMSLTGLGEFRQTYKLQQNVISAPMEDAQRGGGPGGQLMSSD